MDLSLNRHVLALFKNVSKCSQGGWNVTERKKQRTFLGLRDYIEGKVVRRRSVISEYAIKTLLTAHIVCPFEGLFKYLFNSFSFSSTAPLPI